MTKQEVSNFIKKIKAYYPYFSIDSEDAMDEWALHLKPYDNEDVLRKLEEHLNGEKADDPPKLHFITKFLKTTEEKQRVAVDPIIRCNLCGQEMYLSTYDNTHYEKCLAIKTLIMFLKQDGEDVDYEFLDQYPLSKIDKLLEKYLPPTPKNMADVPMFGADN